MFVLVATRFAQTGSRHRAGLYLLGLLSGAKQKNFWVTSEEAGDASPDGMQRLLNFSSGDADAVGDVLRGYVLNRLGDSRGVMVADETAFLKWNQDRWCATPILWDGRVDRQLLGRAVFDVCIGPCTRSRYSSDSR
jgi:hypothetical protein